jgi:NADH-quinone oxidoreductase subunit J
MTAMTIVFYLSAAIAILSTALAISRAHAVHALLYLIVSLLAVALVFLTLGAPFVAALEVITYAGAIMVLFVFVVMLLNLGEQAADQERRWLSPGIWILPALLALILIAELGYVVGYAGFQTFNIPGIGAKQVGAALYGPYVLGVELASMLLLAGLVGAYYLGRQRRRDGREERIA